MECAGFTRLMLLCLIWARDAVARLRSAYMCLRSCQMSNEVPIQAAADAAITTRGWERDMYLAIRNAKTKSPTLPMAAPAASTPTALLARTDPCRPLRSFLCRSCFSIKVALAGKIAGNARKRPPTLGPYFFAMIPVAAVASPPQQKRIAA